MENSSKDKINWDDKFKEFVQIYTKDKKEIELLVKYYSLAKRKSSDIDPSEFEQIYNHVYKSNSKSSE